MCDTYKFRLAIIPPWGEGRVGGGDAEDEGQRRKGGAIYGYSDGERTMSRTELFAVRTEHIVNSRPPRSQTAYCTMPAMISSHSSSSSPPSSPRNYRWGCCQKLNGTSVYPGRCCTWLAGWLVGDFPQSDPVLPKTICFPPKWSASPRGWCLLGRCDISKGENLVGGVEEHI